MRSYCDMGAGTHEVAYRALAVQGYARTGRLDDAHHELADAYDSLARHGDRYLESELHMLKGELLLRRDWGGATGSAQERAEAERQFRSAIDVARRQQARSLELRAATSLSRLLRDHERHAEAADVLSGVDAWFTKASTCRISRTLRRSCTSTRPPQRPSHRGGNGGRAARSLLHLRRTADGGGTRGPMSPSSASSRSTTIGA
jgi:hypothetical protein